MDGSHFVSTVFRRVIEREFSDTIAFLPRHYLKTLDHSWHELMFQRRIFTFCLFSNYYEVQLFVMACLDSLESLKSIAPDDIVKSLRFLWEHLP